MDLTIYQHFVIHQKNLYTFVLNMVFFTATVVIEFKLTIVVFILFPIVKFMAFVQPYRIILIKRAYF